MMVNSTGLNRPPARAGERQKRLTLAVMCLATFVAILDTTVVNLALYSIQASLHTRVSGLQWILDIYNLTYASFILTGGTLGDLFGRRRVFVAGVVLFNLGSLVCALAPGSATLIAGRAVAGLGAALQLPGALSLLTVTFPTLTERARAIAVWGGFNGLAMAIGPTLGGLLVDHFGWRSIFYLILPCGLAILALTSAGVRESADPEGRHLDLRGQTLAVFTLGSFSFAFIQLPVLAWSSPLIIASLLLGVLSLAAFVSVERAAPGGLLPMEIFANRAFSASLADAALMTFGIYAMLFIFPLYLQTVRGDSAVVAGIELLPLSLTFFCVSPVAGRLSTATHPGTVIAVGMSLAGAGILTLAALNADSGRGVMRAALLAVGLGLGLITGPIMTVAVSSLPSQRSGTSSGMVNVARMVGATLGVAILGSVFGAHVERTGPDAAAFLRGMRRALVVGGTAEFGGALIALKFLAGEKGQRRPEGPQAFSVE
jgi:EmrB/QacA subfamily drug resistance transporter